jgi:hypothetical protein
MTFAPASANKHAVGSPIHPNPITAVGTLPERNFFLISIVGSVIKSAKKFTQRFESDLERGRIVARVLYLGFVTENLPHSSNVEIDEHSSIAAMKRKGDEMMII